MAMYQTLDIKSLRAETPGCSNVVHFNHAGSSLMPRSVIDTVVNHTRLEGEIGGYEAEAREGDRIEAVYDQVAGLIGAQRSEIALVENATRAWDMVFYAIPFQPGDRILTSCAEYHSNVIAFLQVRDRGLSIEVIPNDKHDQVDVDALAEMMDERVRLVSISHMPTNSGLVQPAAAIGRAIKDWPALYLLDACQSAGHVPLDVREIGCHALSASSRKYLRGPRGAGFLYVATEKIDELIPPMLDGHAASWVARDRYELRPDARRFENWEKSYANILGTGEAVALTTRLGEEAIWNQINTQSTKLRDALKDLPGVTCTDIGEVQSGIVTFAVEGRSPDEIKAYLRQRKINVETSSVESTRFDMEARHLEKVVRASVHYLTTDNEIDQLVSAISGKR